MSQGKEKTTSQKKNQSEEEKEFAAFNAQTALRSFTEGQEAVRLTRYKSLFEKTEEKNDE